MGNVVSSCAYGAPVLALALAADYLWMLWMRKKMVQHGAIQTTGITLTQTTATWSMAMAYRRQHIHFA